MSESAKRQASRSSKPEVLKGVRSNPINSVLTVDNNGNLQQKGGFIYYENTAGDFVKVYFTDNLDNLQPIVKSTTREDVAQGKPLKRASS